MLCRIACFLAALLAFCAGAMDASAEATKKKLLVVGQGPDGHKPTTHEFNAGVRIIDALLKQFPELEVTTARGDGAWPEGPELIQQSDGVVLYLSQGAKWIEADPRRHDAVAQLIERGGGFVCLHWAIGAKDAQYIEPFVQWLGGCHGGPDRKYKYLETDVTIADGKHPVTAGIAPFRINDEFYYDLKFAKPAGSVVPLLKATIDDRPYTVAWAYQRPDGGRSFGFSGLHYHENWKRPEYRRLVTQGILWSLKQPPVQSINLDLPEETYVLPSKMDGSREHK